MNIYDYGGELTGCIGLSENIDVYTDWKDAQLAEPEHDYDDEHSDGYDIDSEEDAEDPLD